MPRKTLIGIGLCVGALILIISLLRRNDSDTPVQRDIARSLERAKVLKARRDSVAELEGQKRFGKTAEVGETSQVGQTGETGEAGKTGQTGDVGTSSIQEDQYNPQSEHGATDDEEFVGPPAPKPVAQTKEVQRQAPLKVQSGSGSASIPAERFFTTSAMDGLNAKDKQSVFKPNEAVYIYAGIHAPQEEQVKIEWIDPAGKALSPSEYVNIQSNTGVNGYRIYKQRQFRNPGKYEVRLYNGAGVMIGKTVFTISTDI